MDERTDPTASFGDWLRRRRRALDLTQEALAQRANCSRFAIRKIEADERRPSRALAERLARSLAVPPEERGAFLAAARALRRTAVLADPAGVAPDATTAASLASPPLTAAGTLPCIGREATVQGLVDLVGGAGTGAGHVVLIEGEPGIGKTRLIAEVLRRSAVPGRHALRSACYAIEQGMPYQPIIELVTAAFDRCTPAQLRQLPPGSLAELATLVPAVAERLPAAPVAPAPRPDVGQARLFRAIDQLLDLLAGVGRLVIVVDDLHWADDASLQCLHVLARQALRQRLVLLCAYRGEEIAVDGPVARFLDGVRRGAAVRSVSLGRLSAADTARLLAAARPVESAPPGLGAWLHRETDGHPLFLVSMLQSLAERGVPALLDAPAAAASLPEAIRTAVRERVARVPGPARAVLDVAAVLGRRFDFDTLCAVTGDTQAALLDAVEILVGRGLLRETDAAGAFDFGHERIREAIYLDIGGTRRMLLHRAIAEALEAPAAADAPERAARLAEHYARGQVPARALACLLQAAGQAQRLFATREALGLLDRALDLMANHPGIAAADAELRARVQRGAVHAQAGHVAAAVADFERVIAAARAAGDRVLERDTLIQLGMAHRRGDAYERATDCLHAALQASRAMHDEPQAASTLYHLGTVAWSNGRNAEALDHHTQAVAICERLALTDLVAVQALHGLGEAHYADARPAPAIACFERSIALAQAIGDRSYEAENLMMIGWACLGSMGLGDYPRALAQLAAGTAIADASGLEWHVAPLRIAQAHAQAALGRVGEAYGMLRETLATLDAATRARYRIMACNMLGHLLLDLSLPGAAAAALEEGLDVARRAGITYWTALLTANRAIARLRDGHADAGDGLEAALQAAVRHREGWCLPRCYEALAEHALLQGDPALATHWAGQLHALGEQGDLREALARSQRWRGAALHAGGQSADAACTLANALATSEALGTVRLSWDIHRDLARVHRALGASVHAEDHDEAANALAACLDRSLHGTGLRFAGDT